MKREMLLEKEAMPPIFTTLKTSNNFENTCKQQMNISKYDFHDGCLIDVQHFDNKIEFSMESAEISDEELQDKIILSEYGTIKGKLHLDGIKSFKINDQLFSGAFVKEYDRGYIFSFEIQDSKMILIVGWINCPPKIYEETDFFRIEIEAERIYWETIPDLANPFW
jgi:hypothetical protein